MQKNPFYKEDNTTASKALQELHCFPVVKRIAYKVVEPWYIKCTIVVSQHAFPIKPEERSPPEKQDFLHFVCLNGAYYRQKLKVIEKDRFIVTVLGIGMICVKVTPHHH